MNSVELFLALVDVILIKIKTRGKFSCHYLSSTCNVARLGPPSQFSFDIFLFVELSVSNEGLSLFLSLTHSLTLSLSHCLPHSFCSCSNNKSSCCHLRSRRQIFSTSSLCDSQELWTRSTAFSSVQISVKSEHNSHTNALKSQITKQ